MYCLCPPLKCNLHEGRVFVSLSIALVPLVHSIVTHISQRLNKQLTNESMTAPFDLYEVGKSVRLIITYFKILLLFFAFKMYRS